VILGKVMGHLWAAQKSERLTGHKLLLVRPERAYRMRADHLVVIDQVGAEVGQQVIVTIGAPGRWQTGDTRTPIDAAVSAIVDQVQWEAVS